jgi:AraC family transcriptional regulator
MAASVCLSEICVVIFVLLSSGLFYDFRRSIFLAKIAVELERAVARRASQGASSELASRILAQGDGWAVSDVLCTAGPRDPSFEEHRRHVSMAIVAAGTFQYRAGGGVGSRYARQLMTSASLMLGSAGQCFDCGHEHHTGDRCVAFCYRSDFFERLAHDAGASGRTSFAALRLPPLRALSPLVTSACAALAEPAALQNPWAELALRLAARTIQLTSGLANDVATIPLSAEARVTRALRLIHQHPENELTLDQLAAEARLTPWHFLRTFERVTELTPHQYVLRARLRAAAVRLKAESAKVLDIALECGFGDVSNFNRAFRAEFGVSPRAWRRAN